MCRRLPKFGLACRFLSCQHGIRIFELDSLVVVEREV